MVESVRLKAIIKKILNKLNLHLILIELAEEERMKKCFDGIKNGGCLFYPEANVENFQDNKESIFIGENTHVRGELLVWRHGGKINIGMNSFVGPGTRIWSGSHEGIKIGSNVLLSHNVTIIDSDSHEIDYLRWLFGEVKWVRATLLRQSQLEIDVEDTVHLTIGFEERNSESQLVANLNLDFIRHDATRSCTVIGDKGTLRWDGILGEVSLFKPGESDWNVIFTKDNGIEETYVLEWKELIRATQEKRSPTVTAEDGLRVIEIIEAARLSAKNGNQIAVIRTPIRIEDSK